MYKRLTIKDEEYGNYVDNKGSELNKPKVAVSFNGKIHGAVIDRLAELEDKLENGTLVELPCKVGDTVWYIKNYGFGRYIVEDMEVAGFNFSKYENTIWVVGKYDEETSHIYKTKAEAEQKLKELRGEV